MRVLNSKSEAVGYFKCFPCHVWTDGVSTVQGVRIDGGEEFSVIDHFGTLCRERGIEQ